MDDTHPGGTEEADDPYPPSPKHSKMRSDRYDRDREESVRMRERRRSPMEGRLRATARNTVRAQVSDVYTIKNFKRFREMGQKDFKGGRDFKNSLLSLLLLLLFWHFIECYSEFVVFECSLILPRTRT